MPPRHWRAIWCIDFEFVEPKGDAPDPLCMVAIDAVSGREVRLWRDELRRLGRAPFDLGRDVLVVAYAASAELKCFEVLAWPFPSNVLDLFFEHRAATNTVNPPAGGLLEALARHGLAHMLPARKETMRDRILAGPPYTLPEQQDILDYCRDDVLALLRLLPVMAVGINWPQALLRGRYAGAVARMELAGVPIDVERWRLLVDRWSDLRRQLVATVDRDYGLYDGETFKADRFVHWLGRQGIPWDFYPSGQPILESQMFRDMMGVYPQLGPLHELRSTLGKMRLSGLAVGKDGINRCAIHPFRAVSGRNAPSNSQYAFGPATWMRSLIKPPVGHAIAYVDWSAQEIAIAAALSDDRGMIADYAAGDSHLNFAKRAGLVPDDATAKSHPRERAQCKIVNLGINYGMQPYGIAKRLNVAAIEGRALHDAHRSSYPVFWRFVRSTLDWAMLYNRLETQFGWPLIVTAATKPGTIQNFPAQGNGGEMMRIAAIAATEAGLRIVPVHDAFLLTSPSDRLATNIATLREAMRLAGLAVTSGKVEVRTDAKIVRYPNRYYDDRGRFMWGKVQELLAGEPKRKTA